MKVKQFHPFLFLFVSVMTLTLNATAQHRATTKTRTSTAVTPAAPVVPAPPSDGRVTIFIPAFQVVASNVPNTIAEQMRTILVSDLQNDGLYHVMTGTALTINASLPDTKIPKQVNYILQGKIIAHDEKESGFAFKAFKANLGKMIHYGFSFEITNAKTGEIALIKNWDFKVKGGKMGVTTAATGDYGNVEIEPDIAAAYEKNLKEVLQDIEHQKEKIVMN